MNYPHEPPTSRRRFLPAAAAVAAAAGAVLLSAPSRALAQARVTLQSLQDQINAILRGSAPVGVLQFRQVGSNVFFAFQATTPTEIPNRTLTFLKVSPTSKLKVTYRDFYQPLSPGPNLFVRPLIDGNAVGTSTSTLQSEISSFNGINPIAVEGIATDVGPGAHTLSIVAVTFGFTTFFDLSAQGNRSSLPFYLAVEEIP